MEHITVAGHPEPVPASPVAAELLRERLEETRQKRGAEAADQLEARVGERIVLLLQSGKPSIDLGTCARSSTTPTSRPRRMNRPLVSVAPSAGSRRSSRSGVGRFRGDA